MKETAQPEDLPGKFARYRPLVLLSFAFLAGFVLFPFLKSMAMGAVFAVVLAPIYNKLNKFIGSAVLRAALVTLLFLVLVVIPFGLILFSGVQKALQLFHAGVPGWANDLSAQAVVQWHRLPEILDRVNAFLPIQSQDLSKLAFSVLNSAGAWLSNYLQNLLSGVPSSVAAGGVMLFTVYFCLVDGPRLVAFLRENSIFNARDTEHLIRATKLSCQSVVNASIAVGIVQAALMAIAGLVAGTGNLILLTLVTFLASFIPVIGTAPVTLGYLFYYLLNGDTFSAITFAIALVVVSTSDNVVRPWMIQGGANLHPLLAFASAFGGISVMGFFGLFLGPIIVAIFFTMLPLFTQSYRHGS